MTIDQSTDDCQFQIPNMLIGTERQVTKKSRKLCKSVVQAASWEPFVSQLDYVDIRDAPEIIALSGPVLPEDKANTYVFPAPLMDAFLDSAGADDYANLSVVKSLLIEGLGSFWLDLCFLAAVPGLYPRGDPPDIRRRDSVTIIRKVLRSWPALAALAPRYHARGWLPREWPVWASNLFVMARQAGLSGAQVQMLAGAGPADLPTLLTAMLGKL